RRCDCRLRPRRDHRPRRGSGRLAGRTPPLETNVSPLSGGTGRACEAEGGQASASEPWLPPRKAGLGGDPPQQVHTRVRLRLTPPSPAEAAFFVPPQVGGQRRTHAPLAGRS